MNKGWVHWHPTGYGLTDDGRLSVRPLEWYFWHDPHLAIQYSVDSPDGHLVKECEVIPFEDAVQRLAQAAMKATAEELRAGRAAMPKATEAEAYAQQERALRGETRAIERNTSTPEGKAYWESVEKSAEGVNDWPAHKKAGITANQPGIAKPTEGRMMVEFRVDPSKYRVRVRPRGHLFEAYVQTADGSRRTFMAFSHMAEIAVARALDAANVPAPGALMPHPWKRPDGSHIKASWEE